MLKFDSPVISCCTGTEKSQEQFQIRRNWESYNVPVLPSYRNISKWKKMAEFINASWEDSF